MTPILSPEDEREIAKAPMDALLEREAYIDELYKNLVKHAQRMCLKQAFYNHLYLGNIPKLKVLCLYTFERSNGILHDIVHIFQNYDILYRFQSACGSRILADYTVDDDVVSVYLTFDHPNKDLE